jgi:hypothetical protein
VYDIIFSIFALLWTRSCGEIKTFEGEYDHLRRREPVRRIILDDIHRNDSAYRSLL